MKQSLLATKTRKDISSQEKSLNARLLIKAGFIDQLMAGVYSYLPLGYKVIQKIEKIVREEMNSIGGQEILMPAIHPKEVLETTGRWDTIDVLYKFQTFYTKMEVALGSTHEEIITPLTKKFIKSYKDLPLSFYQIQTKFRDEKRAKSGILRGREFIMKDLYSFHTDEQDLDTYYDKAIIAYQNIYKRLGIGDKTYKVYASGGTFSKYSHEFQTLSEIGEDTVYICDKCHIGVNQEIISDQPNCPECSGDLIQKSAIEVGNIFKLNTKFSDAFSLKFTDQNGSSKSVIMGCYGIGISRLMGTLVEIFAESENKMVWPKSIAPFQVHLIGLNLNDGLILEKANQLYTKFLERNIEILFDDRNESTGKKLADADLIGIPTRLIISKKSLENGGIEFENQIYSIDSILDIIS